jgi:hypothetical protein
VLTGTNRQVDITLSATNNGGLCDDGTSNYLYNVTRRPTNGTLTGVSSHLTYKPNPNYEGMDSFQFTVSDGGWASIDAAVTLYVVAGPILTTTCDRFGTAAQLDWSLDSIVQQMWQNGMNIQDFVLSRATNSGGPYTAIYTTTDTSQTEYFDTNGVGRTYYYVVSFEYYDNATGITYESPASNEAAVADRGDLIPYNAVWDVTDITDTNHPVYLGKLQAPFSDRYPDQYVGISPSPNTSWPTDTTWTNHITMYIPTNSVDLSQVQYSIAIDNDYWLYVNNSSSSIDSTNHEDQAVWAPLKSFESVAPGILHYGTNDIGVVIRDRGTKDYFSMVVTTNACGW